jgi:predicted DNA repair protein MutK
MTRLSLKAMAIAAGLLWGGAILCVGLINLAVPSYGMNFIQMTSSVCPWFHVSRTIGNVVIGTVDGLIDGAIAGLIFAFLYNAVASVPTHAERSHQQA